ncbi:hypothetical protein SSYM_0876 [Serratia symbiotica str. Tucson]|uniref:Uncharacterized protein n=1 Tax=Serratia symbiotica str. Tucson TaxID=914128 RepID=E9CL09_9GAMM|nr:hypothetical protein SSYM_0876 [Serratia symbiotica str. Tucson]
MNSCLPAISHGISLPIPLRHSWSSPHLGYIKVAVSGAGFYILTMRISQCSPLFLHQRLLIGCICCTRQVYSGTLTYFFL